MAPNSNMTPPTILATTPAPCWPVEYIAQLSKSQRESMGAIQTLRGIVERGVAAGVMRKDLDAIDLHMSISALCFFNVANRHTFSTIFKVDMASPVAAAARRESVTQMILRFVAP